MTQKTNDVKTGADGDVAIGDLFGEWISCDERLPELTDDSVLAYFADSGGIDMVHIQDYFADITNGVDKDGKQQYTKWYLCQNVTHWMALPDPPNVERTDREHNQQPQGN